MSDEHPSIHRLSKCITYFQRQNANDTDIYLALNLQPESQDHMYFKRFSYSDCVNGNIWYFGIRMKILR